jgi:hypothetical protein
MRLGGDNLPVPAQGVLSCGLYRASVSFCWLLLFSILTLLFSVFSVSLWFTSHYFFGCTRYLTVFGVSSGGFS